MTTAPRLQRKTRLSLRRPIAFLDLETTGLNPAIDRIVEIAVLKLRPDGTEESFHSQINPEIRIPIEASRIHGITNKDLRDKPKFEQIAAHLANFLRDCDLAGFNIGNFDVLILQEEFRRAGREFSMAKRSQVDIQRIYHIQEPRDLTAAYKFYCGFEHERAHSAFEDVKACRQILEAQLEKHSDLPSEVVKLAEFCDRDKKSRFMDSGRWFEPRDRKPHFARGQHRGRPLKEIADLEPDYLGWLLETDLPRDTRYMVTRALKKSR